MGNTLLDRLSEIGAVWFDSHLVLTSKRHSDGYINLRKLAGKTGDLVRVGYDLSDLIEQQIAETDFAESRLVLVGPETMGRTFAHEVACNRNDDNYPTEFVWCEPRIDKTAMVWNHKLEFAEMVAGQHCIIVDDVLTTAKTLKQTVDLVRATGGIVEGAAVVVRRNPDVTAEAVGIPWIAALCELDLKDYDPNNCPLCRQKIPMVLHPGHGHEWIEKNPDYPVAP